MDVDTVKIEKLTKEEREKCFREGHCLRCRKPGHFMKDCNSFTEKSFQLRKPQEKPKRVAVVKDDEQELENLAKGIEEVTIGKVTVEDF